MKRFIPAILILLSLIPALIIYSGIQENFANWPPLHLPGYTIVVGFVCIILIVILALRLGKNED